MSDFDDLEKSSFCACVTCVPARLCVCVCTGDMCIDCIHFLEARLNMTVFPSLSRPWRSGRTSAITLLI